MTAPLGRRWAKGRRDNSQNRRRSSNSRRSASPAALAPRRGDRRGLASCPLRHARSPGVGADRPAAVLLCRQGAPPPRRGRRARTRPWPPDGPRPRAVPLRRAPRSPRQSAPPRRAAPRAEPSCCLDQRCRPASRRSTCAPAPPRCGRRHGQRRRAARDAAGQRRSRPQGSKPCHERRHGHPGAGHFLLKAAIRAKLPETQRDKDRPEPAGAIAQCPGSSRHARISDLKVDEKGDRGIDAERSAARPQHADKTADDADRRHDERGKPPMLRGDAPEKEQQVSAQRLHEHPDETRPIRSADIDHRGGKRAQYGGISDVDERAAAPAAPRSPSCRAAPSRARLGPLASSSRRRLRSARMAAPS